MVTPDIESLEVSSIDRGGQLPSLIGAVSGSLQNPPTVEGHPSHVFANLVLGYRSFEVDNASKKANFGLPHAVSAGLITYFILDSEDNEPNYLPPENSAAVKKNIMKGLLSGSGDPSNSLKYSGQYVSIVESPNATKQVLIHDTNFANDVDLQIIALRGNTRTGVVAEILKLGIDKRKDKNFSVVLQNDVVAVVIVTGAIVAVPKTQFVIDADNNGVNDEELITAIKKLGIFLPKGNGPDNCFSLAAMCLGNPEVNSAPSRKLNEDSRRNKPEVDESRLKIRNSSEKRKSIIPKLGIAAKVIAGLSTLIAVQLSPVVPVSALALGSYWLGKKFIPERFNNTSARGVIAAVILGLGIQWVAAGYSQTTSIIGQPIESFAKYHYDWYDIQSRLPVPGLKELLKIEASGISKLTGAEQNKSNSTDPVLTLEYLTKTDIDPSTGKPYGSLLRLPGESDAITVLPDGISVILAPNQNKKCIQSPDALPRVAVTNVKWDNISPKSVFCITRSVLTPNP